MGWLSGGEGGVREHEGHESYLWVVSVDAGVAGGGPASGAVLRMAMAAACGGAPVSGRRQGGHGRVQRGRTKCGRSAARHRGACARLAASNRRTDGAVAKLGTGASWPVRETSRARIGTGGGRGDDSWGPQLGKISGMLQCNAR